jgi:hypothetical protein
VEINYSFLINTVDELHRCQTMSNKVTFLMNANFPAGLSISHSSFASTSQFKLSSLDVSGEDFFGFLGAEAQDTAIAKYGIAGRVW